MKTKKKMEDLSRWVRETRWWVRRCCCGGEEENEGEKPRGEVEDDEEEEEEVEEEMKMEELSFRKSRSSSSLPPAEVCWGWTSFRSSFLTACPLVVTPDRMFAHFF